MNPHDASLARDNRIDELCDRFDRQLQAGESPRMEDVLAASSDLERSKLLRELLLVELELRRTNGESPAASEYESRFPNDATPHHGPCVPRRRTCHLRSRMHSCLHVWICGSPGGAIRRGDPADSGKLFISSF